MPITNLKKLEMKLEKKQKLRDKKARPKMKVSGKRVKDLQKIIINKS
jgi:hypothetical protein